VGFSTLAYGWILLVLCVLSPGRVSIYEAIITLALYGGLVGAAHLIDTQ
jgi:hypothetical protein